MVLRRVRMRVLDVYKGISGSDLVVDCKENDAYCFD